MLARAAPWNAGRADPGEAVWANIRNPRQDLRWVCGAMEVIACIMNILTPRDLDHRTMIAGHQY